MADVYQMVTDRIIAQLEAGIIPWRKTWQGSQPINYVTRKPYQGINTLLLDKGGEYLTFLQAKAAGGNVRKGEKSQMIVFYKQIDAKDAKDANGELKKIPFLKYSNVFHLSQCEGIESRLQPVSLNDVKPIESAENILADYIRRSGVKLENVEGSDSAFYSPANDSITLPIIKQFTDAAEYYSTAFHEAVHSTGHKTRLDRISKTAAFGSGEYSKEELCAEIGAAMVMNTAGIELQSTFENSVAYIGSWLKRLKGDNRFVVTAASAAQKAANMILDIAGA